MHQLDLPTQMPTHTFSKSFRLSDKVDFSRIFKAAKAIKSEQFVFLYHRNTLDHPRFALSIKAKRFKNIVSRNRAQRWFRECFRQDKAQLGNIDLIILSKKHVRLFDSLSHQQVQSEWNIFLSQLK
jgi:ribonuclease P protein component